MQGAPTVHLPQLHLNSQPSVSAHFGLLAGAFLEGATLGANLKPKLSVAKLEGQDCYHTTERRAFLDFTDLVFLSSAEILYTKKLLLSFQLYA